MVANAWLGLACGAQRIWSGRSGRSFVGFGCWCCLWLPVSDAVWTGGRRRKFPCLVLNACLVFGWVVVVVVVFVVIVVVVVVFVVIVVVVVVARYVYLSFFECK